jgi:hypothetical protein
MGKEKIKRKHATKKETENAKHNGTSQSSVHPHTIQSLIIQR